MGVALAAMMVIVIDHLDQLYTSKDNQRAESTN